MDPGEQSTGTRDEQYNLISVLYHALKGADICDLYALDAEAGGRTDLYEYFREAHAAQSQLAERAKELLGIAGPQAPPEEGLLPEAPPESDLPVDLPTGDAPLRGGPTEPAPDEDVAGPGVPPDAPRTGEVPPRTGDFPPSPSEPPPPGGEQPPRP